MHVDKKHKDEIKEDEAIRPRKRKSLLLPILLCLAGLVILFFPVAMDWYASYQSGQIISQMTDAYDPLDNPELIAVKDNAKAYNDRMAGVDVSGIEIKPYKEQMIFRNIHQMAWIDIPKIEVALPVYHGTDPDTLAAGVGHMEGSSLPIGGDSTHSVLTGHSGMQGERMFDEIRKLEVGDTFIIHSLGEPLAYRVTSIEVVWPNEKDSLKIQIGRDLCTLMTCTPYGVNDHRLLVHAERCEYLPEMEPVLPPKISYWNTRSVIFFVGAVVVGLFLIFLIARSRAAKYDPIEEAAKDEKRKQKRKKAKNLVLPAILIIAGLAILLGSLVADWYETYKARNEVSMMADSYAKMSAEEKKHILNQAEIYNEVLAGDTVRYSKMDEELWDYDHQLAYDENHQMGWVDIPKINTVVPIYHGTDEDVLMLGAGHVEQTSLPIGGESAHAVVSAHSGMALTRMFDELRVMQKGDSFIIWVLGDPYAYRVVDTKVVMPDETGSLKIEHGKDKVTLLTCTPYGVNDHRLLVIAERIPYYPELDTVPMEAYFNYRTIPFLIGVAIAIPGLGLIIRAYRRRKKEALEESREKPDRKNS